MLKNRLKMVLEGLWRRFLRVLKIGLNMEASWDRFSIDFGTISGALLGGPKATKHWPAWVRKHFGLFSAHLNISCLLGSKKYRFWIHFGLQDEVQNRTRWLQEGSWTKRSKFLRGPTSMSKNRWKKSHATLTGHASRGWWCP